VFDWRRVPAAALRRRPLVLAGGLTAANVGAAIAAVQPWAVDVSSGVEASKGVKDPARIRDFIAAVRAADADRTEP
jgi:phosphoribosylanthranilate isomerase